MKKRLIEFLAYLGMGQTKFEEKVRLSRGFVNNVGDSIREANLKKISEVYPELNINWLKTGEGEMIKDKNTNKVKGNGNTSVAGNGNQVTHNDFAEMIELQKGYQELMRTSQAHITESQAQISELISIIKDLNQK